MTVTERKRANSRHQPVGRWIRPEKRLAIYLRDEFTCQHCMRNMLGLKASEYGLDHLTPRSDKRCTNAASNLVMSCKECNDARGNKRLLQWYKGRGLSIREVSRLRSQGRQSLARYMAQAMSILNGGTKGDNDAL